MGEELRRGGAYALNPPRIEAVIDDDGRLHEVRASGHPLRVAREGAELVLGADGMPARLSCVLIVDSVEVRLP